MAQRLDTIADYDRIVVLEEGEIREEGDPLLFYSGNYHGLASRD